MLVCLLLMVRATHLGRCQMRCSDELRRWAGMDSVCSVMTINVDHPVASNRGVPEFSSGRLASSTFSFVRGLTRSSSKS